MESLSRYPDVGLSYRSINITPQASNEKLEVATELGAVVESAASEIRG